jgi:hypothetical protein
LFDDGGHSVRLTADRTEGGWHVSGAIDADITFEAGADDVAGASLVTIGAA